MLDADDAAPTMSDTQRAVLLDVLGGAAISFEQYQEAIAETLKCAEDAGLMIDGPSTVDRGGQPVVDWGWNDPAQPDGDPKLGEYCRTVHSLGIEQAYLNSGFAKENERRQLEAFRPGILECYASAGVALTDPSIDIYQLLNDTEGLAGDQMPVVDECIRAIDVHVS